MEVAFTPRFKRLFKKLPSVLQEETLEKIELFKNANNHTQLKVHKLQGRLSSDYSFSVNYRYRIVFSWEEDGALALFHAIGDHSVYE